MSAARLERRWRVVAPLAPAPLVDIVVPAHNDERDLARSVQRLHAYLQLEFPFSACITIADNASTDGTWAVASHLAGEISNIRLLRLNQTSPNRAIAAAWLISRANVVAHFDDDVAADLPRLLLLVAPIISGHSDVCVGSRRTRGGGVVTGARFGSKAIRTDVARRLLPTVMARNWFFDTELLVRAMNAGLRVHRLPVD